MLLIIVVVLFLICTNGLYVAAEFSAVSSRRPRLAQQADEGNQSAQYALDIIETPHKLDNFIAACQLGITLTSLILGFYGQAELVDDVVRLLTRFGSYFNVTDPSSLEPIAATLLLFGLTIIAVIFGELIPKNLGVQMPERLFLLTLRPMRWSIWLFRPLIWFFNGSSALIMRLFGASSVSEHAHIHSPEEIRILVEESSDGGVLAQDERKLLINTLSLRDVTARKVMIPRNHMLTADVNLQPEELLTILAKSRYSRLPLYEKNIDKIVGFVHLKDLLHLIYNADKNGDRDGPQTVREAMREVVFVPETTLVEGTLASMQRDRNYLVIVADEYGGTSGMITVEDLFEEIIGEFYDEFDQSRQRLRIAANNRLHVRGDILLEDLNEWLDFQLPTQDVDTVGGLVFSMLERIPKVGETVAATAVRTINPKPVANGLPPEEERDPLEEIAQVNVKEGEGEGEEEEVKEFELNIRVERMTDNGVAEVSFKITDEEVDMLRKHEIS